MTWVSEVGFKTGDEFSKGRGISYFFQFQTGPRYEGQFYPDHETMWGIGLKFVLSDHLISPSKAPESPAAPTPTPSAAPRGFLFWMILSVGPAVSSTPAMRFGLARISDERPAA